MLSVCRCRRLFSYEMIDEWVERSRPLAGVIGRRAAMYDHVLSSAVMYPQKNQNKDPQEVLADLLRLAFLWAKAAERFWRLHRYAML